MPRLSVILLSLLVVFAARHDAAAGKDKGGDASITVEGDIALPPAGPKEPAAQYLGFIDRIPNPITGLRPFDPRPESFVYLDGGPGGADASKSDGSTVTWELQSETFVPVIKPFLLGQAIQIKNTGKKTLSIDSSVAGVLGDTTPIGAGGTRPLTIKEGQKPVVFRSDDSPHLEGRAVALPTKYFAPIKRDGSFKIENVPPGKYTLRVWYKDGWLTTVDKQIEVGGKMERVKIALPENLESPAPDAKPAQK
jgi:hypothetical protein